MSTDLDKRIVEATVECNTLHKIHTAAAGEYYAAQDNLRTLEAKKRADEVAQMGIEQNCYYCLGTAREESHKRDFIQLQNVDILNSRATFVANTQLNGRTHRMELYIGKADLLRLSKQAADMAAKLK